MQSMFGLANQKEKAQMSDNQSIKRQLEAALNTVTNLSARIDVIKTEIQKAKVKHDFQKATRLEGELKKLKEELSVAKTPTLL